MIFDIMARITSADYDTRRVMQGVTLVGYQPPGVGQPKAREAA
jgi:hypothetical protein